MARLKIKARDNAGFMKILKECETNHIHTHVVSPKRFMVSTDELTPEEKQKFTSFGASITADVQYSLESMMTSAL